MDRHVLDRRKRPSGGRLALHAGTVMLAAMLVMASLRPDGLVAFAAGPERLYVGNQASLSAMIPASWSFDPTGSFDYAGADGYIQSGLVPRQTLFEACTFTAEQRSPGRSPLPATWTGQAACTFDTETSAGAGRVLVIPLPKTISQFGTDFGFAFVMADRDHFDRVVATLSFDPARVSPEAFVASVIDLVEARAWWSDRVDWETQRPFLLEQAAALPDLASSDVIVQQLMGILRDAGDHHSVLLSPEGLASWGEGDGFGMQANGGWVQAIFPGSPADRAGIRAGDRIVAVDGGPVRDTYGFDPSYTWGTSVTLSIERPGTPNSLTVLVVAGSYAEYRPPHAALDGALGYIEIPQFNVPGREGDFVAAANDQVGIIDRRGACGWILDLRLNRGGSFYPMVSAIGPILGDGTFVGWQAPDGIKTWVSYSDGAIVDNGRVVANILSPSERYQLAAPHPPVAVLLGPLTASSGEVTALAFRGRPDSRSFGTKTSGFTTANQFFRLFDGSGVLLANAAMMDRSGQTYLTGIVPDEVVIENWSMFGTENDPVIQAASEWLLAQDACAGASGTPEASPAARP